LEQAEAHAAHLRYCTELADYEVGHWQHEVARLEAAVLRANTR
jgi:hypothetical protein